MNLARVSHWDDFDRAFQRFFGLPNYRVWHSDERERMWVPSVDIRETAEGMEFSLDVPGLEKDEISISVEDGRLMVEGERKSLEGSGELLRSERWFGKVHRSFRLPRTVDSEKVTASLKNGVLTLVLPKREEAKPREIPVTVQ